MDALTKVNKELMTKPVRVMVKRLGPNYSRNTKQEFSVSEREKGKKTDKTNSHKSHNTGRSWNLSTELHTGESTLSVARIFALTTPSQKKKK